MSQLVAEKRKKIISTALWYLGAVFVIATAATWYVGPQSWKISGLSIRFGHDWWKTWWIGAVLWMVALGLGKAAPWSPVVARLMKPLASRVGVDPADQRVRWKSLGAFLGGVWGSLLAVQYYYLVPGLVWQELMVLAAVAIFLALHLAFFSGYGKLFSRFGPEAVSALRKIGYLFFWSLIVTLILPHWEARATDPLGRELLWALLVGTGGAWLIGVKPGLPGKLGLVRKYAPAALVALLAVSGLLSWSRTSAAPEQAPRDRVILITVDTTRPDYLSCYGYPQPTSPNIDRLAASGARFTRAFCPIGHTDPAHASILSGTYPRTHGVYPFEKAAPGNVSCLAEVFQDRGYVTAAVTSRAILLPPDINMAGFQFMSGPDKEIMESNSAADAYRRAANLIYRHRKENLFLWVHFFDPHQPYTPHPFDSREFSGWDTRSNGGANFLRPGHQYSDQRVQTTRRAYASEIHYMDHWIGKLLDLVAGLEPLPERKPFVILIADHGEALGEYQDYPVRYAFGHTGITYNAVAHVPLLISWPGQIPKGEVIDQLVSSTDVAPTILDYIFKYLKFPAQGKSLRAFINGEVRPDRFTVMERMVDLKDLHDPNRPWLDLPQYAVITQGRKLIYTVGGPVELYDLNQDWSEKNNLAPTSPESTQQMIQLYDQWLEKTPKAKTEKRDFTDSQKRAFRALGYME